MKVGLRPKKFFYDIMPIPRSEIMRRKFEIEEHQRKKAPQKKPLVLDTVLGDTAQKDIRKRISRIWQNENPRINIAPREVFKAKANSLEQVAGSVLEKRAQEVVPASKKIKPKKLLKKSLVLFVEFSLIALMIYNGLSLYFEKNWLIEKLNNLSIASKARLVNAQESLSSLDRQESTQELEKAGVHLNAIKEELLNQGEYNYILPNYPMLSDKLTTGQNILELGLMLKDTNSDINSFLNNISGDEKQGENILRRVDNLKPAIEKIEKRINRADVILKNNQQIKDTLGVETSSKIENIIDKSEDELAKIKKAYAFLPLILGANGDNRYLVLFMNNAEMRPGGGFPGNYGVINFENNNYKDMKINDIYYLQWLKRDRLKEINEDRDSGVDPRTSVALPADLYLADAMDKVSQKGYYNLFSSNWSLDFKDNAKRAIYLYKNVYEQGDVAGVIALTPNVIEDVLAVVGPVKMDEFGIEYNKDNFRETTEYKVEFDNPYRIEGKKDYNPKQILADFGPKLMQKISEADLSTKIKLAEIILDNVNQKQILLYHTDPKVESLISEFNSSGEIKDTQGDFLGIAHSNLNGQKNGQSLERIVKFSSQVSGLGFANDELNLTILLDEDNPRPLHEKDISYVEIIVPEGSRIREAKMEGKDFIGSIDYFSEAKHTVLGFWVELQPGEAKNIILKYQAPLKGYSDSGYVLNIFKQSGAKAIDFEGTINFEDSSKYGSYPTIISGLIDSDKIIKP
jgi:hypothetical protein